MEFSGSTIPTDATSDTNDLDEKSINEDGLSKDEDYSFALKLSFWHSMFTLGCFILFIVLVKILDGPEIHTQDSENNDFGIYELKHMIHLPSYISATLVACMTLLVLVWTSFGSQTIVNFTVGKFMVIALVLQLFPKLVVMLSCLLFLDNNEK